MISASIIYNRYSLLLGPTMLENFGVRDRHRIVGWIGHRMGLVYWKPLRFGIFLSAQADKMIWDMGLQKGLSIVQEIYHSIPRTGLVLDPCLWYQISWDWSIPLKIICFGWLELHNRILTWNSLKKGGFCIHRMEDKYHRNEKVQYSLRRVALIIWFYNKVEGHFYHSEDFG